MSLEEKHPIYTVGGTVQAGGGFYLSRQADDELLNLCRQSVFAYILTARQVGKSSLMVRTAQRLKQEGACPVIIDLTNIGVQVTPEQWYFGLLDEIKEPLTLDIDLAKWWQEHAQFGFTQRLTKFFQGVLLKQISAPIVIFVDEIDTTLSLDFTDDFFVAIRYLYNARATSPEFKRLSFALIGVATPGDLIRDPQRTPFNIGQRVDLGDFNYEEAAPLAEGLNLTPGEAKQALRWVMKWTNGHPYLTQRLCRAMVDARRLRWTETDVDRVVADTFFGAMSEQDNNLQFVRDMLTKRAPDVEGALTTYREIRAGNPTRDEEQSLVKSHLKLSGVVRRERAELRIRNSIYAAVFDERWIKQHLRIDLVKRVKRVSVKLAPYVAAALVILSLFAWWNVWTLRMKAAEAESRTTTAEAAYQSALSALKQAEEKTAELNEEARIAKEEAQTAKEEAARRLVMAQIAVEEASRQLMIAQQAKDEANARLQAVEKEAKDLKQEAVNARDAAAKAHDAVAKAEDRFRRVRQDTDDAISHLEEANKRLREAEGGLNAAKEAIELANELQRAQDEKAKKEAYAREIFRLHAGPVTNVAIHPQNSNRIVTAGADGKAHVVDITDKMSAKSALHSQSALNSAVFSSDGASVVTISANGAIRVYDANTGKEQIGGHVGATPLKTIHQWDEGRRVLANFSGFVAMGGTESDTLEVRDLTDPNKGPVVLRGLQGKLESLAVSPAGKFIVAVNKNNTLQVWRRTEPEKAPAELQGHKHPVTSLAFSPDESLLVTASADNTARIWSLADPRKKPVVMDKHNKPLTSVAFNPNGKWVVTASEDGRAMVWLAESGKVVAELRNRTFISVNYVSHRRFPLNIFFPVSFDFLSKGELPQINSAAFSPDGKYVVTASDDGAAQIWNVGTAKSVATLRGHILGVQSAIFTPDGRSIITGGADHTVRLWDLCKEKIMPIPVCGPAYGRNTKSQRIEGNR